MSVPGADAPSGASSSPISGRAVAAGGVFPTILYLGYKYGLVDRLGWPAMPELEAILPGLAVSILAYMHHRATRSRERRDRAFLLRLVASGVTVPVPPNPYVRETVPVVVPVRAAGDAGPPPGA